MIEFEVRGTLGADDRGRGLAGNTGSAGSGLKPGREHWQWGITVDEERGGGGGGRGARGGGGGGGDGLT